MVVILIGILLGIASAVGTSTTTVSNVWKRTLIDQQWQPKTCDSKPNEIHEILPSLTAICFFLWILRVEFLVLRWRTRDARGGEKTETEHRRGGVRTKTERCRGHVVFGAYKSSQLRIKRLDIDGWPERWHQNGIMIGQRRRSRSRNRYRGKAGKLVNVKRGTTAVVQARKKRIADVLNIEISKNINKEEKGTMTEVTTATPVIRLGAAAMPRPGQPGAACFDGKEVSEFLQRWNLECRDFGIPDDEKCERIPYYCTKEVKDIVEYLTGYTKNDWPKLQEQLKDLYWQDDTQRDSTEALNILISNAAEMDLNAFVMKYETISASLVEQGALSPLDRVHRLLDGLTERLRERVLEFCAKKEWKLSTHDTGKREPSFEELQDFVLNKANTAQKLKVYEKGRAAKERAARRSAARESGESESGTAMTSAKSNTKKPQQQPRIENDTIVELSKQMAALALKIEANLIPASTPSPMSRPTAAAPTNSLFPPRVPRCVWCDSTEHLKSACGELTAVLGTGQIKFNDLGHLCNAVTGEEIPPKFGRGGMKSIWKPTPVAATPVHSISVNHITLEGDKPVASLGTESTVCLVTIHDDGRETHEYIDANIEEKRKRDEIEQGRQVRPRTDESPTPGSSQLFGIPPLNSVSDENTALRKTDKPMYRNTLTVNERVNIGDIVEKILKCEVVVSIAELLAASPETHSQVVEALRTR